MITNATVRRACAIGLVAFVLASCEKDDTYAGERNTNTTRDATADRNEMAPATFVEKAAVSGMYEVQAAELALQKQLSEPVRNLAQRLQADHQKANDDLKSAAAEMNVTVPAALDDTHQSMLKELQGLNGQEFEAKYLEQQRKGHNDAIDLFERAARQLPKGRLATFAQDKLPTLREHLDMVQQRMGANGNNTGR